jgi:sulfur-oxidizing protein SoxZ
MSAMVNVPETATPGEIVEIKILISHPMETGFRTGQDGKLVPRNIIHELRATYNGAEVYRVDLHPSIAANPFFAFHLRAERSGEVAIVWIDEAGAEHVETRTLTVT